MLDRPPPLIFPPALNPIAYIVGVGPALRLARLNDGLPVWIPHPRWIDHDQLVVGVLGIELARELCDEMGGQYWQPPDPEEVERPVLFGRAVLSWAEILVPVPEIAEREGWGVSQVHTLLTAVAIWYQTGDLELAAKYAGESPVYLSLLLNRGY